MELSAFVIPATLAMFSIAFGVVWHYGSKAAFWWMLAYAGQCTGFLGEMVPTAMNEGIQTLSVDAVFLAAFVGFAQGICLFFDWPRRILTYIGLALLSYVVVAWQVVVADSLKGELLAVDYGLASLVLLPLLLNLRSIPRSFGERGILAVTVVTILNCVAISSAFAIFGDTSAGFDTYMDSGYVEASYAVNMFLNVLVPVLQLAAVALRTIGDQRHASEVDPLTGLLNRRGFHRAADGAATGTLVVADIDHFKRVNDGFGHAVGDEVIVAFASEIRRRMPPGCVAARFGGEEFVVFLPGGDVEVAAASARLVNTMFGELVARRFELPFTVTASFGVAEARGDASTLEDDIARADRALYAAKQAGRNRVVVDGDGTEGGVMCREQQKRPLLRVA